MILPDFIETLRGRAGEWRDLLVAWANINSGSHHAEGLARMRSALALEFARLPGVSVEALPLAGTSAEALSIRCRSEAPQQVLLSGHYDTVYGATHPFQACEFADAQTLRGPGVADMKGGLVTMLAALHAFAHSPAAPALGWEALLTPDEEIGSTASEPVLAAAARRHRLGLVFEPARGNGDLVRSRKGTGNFTLTVHGRAAHAGRVPNDGRNAIAALAEILVGVHGLPAEFPGVLLNIGRIEGGGPLNVVPDFAQAGLNIRTMRKADEAAVLARLGTLMAPVAAREGFRVELGGRFDSPPKECGPVEEAAFAAWQACGRDLGLAPFSWVHAGGGSDGNLLSAAGLPNLDGLGPVGDGLHSEREFCLVPTIVERAAVAALFLHRLAAGEIALPQRTD